MPFETSAQSTKRTYALTRNTTRTRPSGRRLKVDPFFVFDGETLCCTLRVISRETFELEACLYFDGDRRVRFHDAPTDFPPYNPEGEAQTLLAIDYALSRKFKIALVSRSGEKRGRVQRPSLPRREAAELLARILGAVSVESTRSAVIFSVVRTSPASLAAFASGAFGASAAFLFAPSDVKGEAM